MLLYALCLMLFTHRRVSLIKKIPRMFLIFLEIVRYKTNNRIILWNLGSFEIMFLGLYVLILYESNLFKNYQGIEKIYISESVLMTKREKLKQFQTGNLNLFQSNY